MHIHNMSTCVLGWWRMKNSWIRYYYISQSCETNISQTYLGCATDLVIANDIDFHLSKEEVLKQIVIKTKVMLILWYTYAYECSYYICVICGTLWTADFSMNPLENVYKWKDFSPNLCRITRIYNHIPQIYGKSRNITMAMKAIPLLRIYNKYLHAHKPFPHTLSIYNLEKDVLHIYCWVQQKSCRLQWILCVVFLQRENMIWHTGKNCRVFVWNLAWLED